MTTATIVQPKLDYSVNADDDSTTYTIHTTSRARRLIIQPFMMLLAWPLLGFFAMWLIGVFSGARESGLLFMLFLATLAVTLLISWWGTYPKAVKLHIDAKAVTIGGKSYLMEHITNVGWRSSGGYVVVGSNAAVQGAKLSYEMSGNIYLQYGSKEVVIVTGLHPDRIENIHSELLRRMKSMGY